MEFINNFVIYLSQNWLEWLGFIAGVTGVWLNIKQIHWAWLIGNISVLMYIVVFFQTKLYADMGLNIFYLISGFYGWYEWLFGRRNKEKLKVIRLSSNQMILWLACGIPVAMALYWILKIFTDASVPEMDAPLTAFSFIGQFMLARKILQNWLVWVVVDFLSVGMYLYKGLYPTAVFFLIITAMAYKGYLEWKKELEPSQKEVPL
jgi:nicotinamide mononucleotide transporter